ncbi:MAG: FG-GAP-like repeat-containing protein [Armatimonadota bacterium]
MTNHALHRPYMAVPAPATSYADDAGPEEFVDGAFYRGQLTDGVAGPDDYRAGEWVGWRQTSYRDPIIVEIDLDGAKRVDRIEATVCARSDNIEPPDRIDVALVSPDFPFEVPVQVTQVALDQPWEPGETQVLTLAGDLPGLRAERVRLSFRHPAWSYLFVDEIRVLGADGEGGGLLPAQDFTIEAEELAGEPVEVEGASGGAALLDAAGETLTLEIPLPAGDYTIRVRSLAVEPDTFSEVELRCGDEPMRAHAVTNNVFTWQRSHFTRSGDGPATISLTLAEGPGVYLDTIRIHRLTLNEPIAQLRRFQRDTLIATGGEARCVVAIDDDGHYAEQAARLVAEVERRAGARPEVLRGDQITEEHFLTTGVVALGDRESNFAILGSSPEAWSFIPAPPGGDEPQIYVDIEPRGTGVNTVVLGGVDEAQVTASVDAVIERLDGGEALSLPWVRLPEPGYVDDRDHYREVAVESGRWLRQGAIRRLHRDWKYFADDTFVLLGYRYLEYLDSPDTIRQVPNDGFIDAETQKIVGNWSQREHHESFTDLERLQMTNLILLMARKCKQIFDRECAEGRADGRYHSDEEIYQILEQRPLQIAHNHQTFPAYAIATAGDYFGKYYDLPEADDWLRWADMFMEGPLLSSKPMEDCWGYMDITTAHMARYAAMTGRWGWFEQPMIYQFLKLRLMSVDNMGAGVGYGDVGAYSPGDGPLTPEANAQTWAAACGGRLDISRADYRDLMGVYVHPLEPMYHQYYAGESAVEPERAFDKISFRDQVDPTAPYLLLDGISGGYHGHWDGNSILRFTDNNRLWLCEGDYRKPDPKDHNTLTIMRDAESDTPVFLSSLEAHFDAGPWGATVTRTAAYTGLDWDRHLVFDRGSDAFLLFDEVTAIEPGGYDVRARFRSLGLTALDDRTWHVQQQGEHFFLHAPGAERIAEATDPEDAGNWARYEFVEDSTPKLLSHGSREDLQPGERMVLPTVFYATSEATPRHETRRLAEGAIVIAGDLQAIAGVGALSLDGLSTDARSYVLGPSRMMLIDGTRLTAGGEALVEASAPVRLAIEVEAGNAIVETDAPVTLTVSGCGPAMQLQPGRHELAGEFAAMGAGLRAAWQSAWAAAQAGASPQEPAPTRNMTAAFEVEMPAEVTVLRAGDLTGDGVPEFLSGCADGSLVVLNAAGDELWRHEFGAAIHDIAIGDVVMDGAPEVAAGVADSHLHVLSARGEVLWRRFFEAYGVARAVEGHPRALLIEDFDGDGIPEIAVAAENSFCYVLDNTGEVKDDGGGPWEIVWRSRGVAIDAADLTGDGMKELLTGYEYFSQRIVDFSRSGRNRLSVVRSSTGGTSVITTADVSGDGLPDALYGDVDGRVTACTVSPEDDQMARVHWTKTIGDDRVAALAAADLTGDGSPEIALASHSGFVALLDAGGEVLWVRYAANQVTDATVLGDAIARTSRDGSLAIYDREGGESARWHLGEPLERLVADTTGDRPLVVTAGGRFVRGAYWER